MKIVSFYDMAPDALSKVMTHFPAHRARLDEFHTRGVLSRRALLSTRQKALWQFSRHARRQKNSFRAIRS